VLRVALVKVWNEFSTILHMISVLLCEFFNEHMLLDLYSVENKGIKKIVMRKPYRLWKNSGTREYAKISRGNRDAGTSPLCAYGKSYQAKDQSS